MGNLHHNLKVIKVCMHEILEKLMLKHWKAYNHNHLLSRIDPRSCTQMQRHKAYPICPIKILEIRRLIILYKISRPFWLWRFNQWFHVAFPNELPCCYKLYLRVLCLNSWRCYTFGLGQTFWKHLTNCNGWNFIPISVQNFIFVFLWQFFNSLVTPLVWGGS
jgi:hypothetical protein